MTWAWLAWLAMGLYCAGFVVNVIANEIEDSRAEKRRAAERRARDQGRDA